MSRFLYVCADSGIPVPGGKGASIHVASVCRAFADMGLDGDLYTVRPCADSLGPVRIHSLPLKRSKNEGLSESERWSQRERDLFLSNGDIQAAIGTDQRPDFVYERYSLWSTGGLAYARANGIPFILEVNSPLPEEANQYRSLHHPELAEGVASLLLREADGIVCVSRIVAAWVKRHRGHDRGVWLVPNGVDPDLFAPQPDSRPEPLPPRDVPLIGFAGSFRPWHGLRHLLNAFEILLNTVPSAHLVCVGDGPERAAFEQRVHELGLGEQVHLTGHVPHDQVPRWLGGVDVTAAPYPPLEEFYFSPLKIFEFMALGLPVVATKTGQIREILPHEERGFLYSAGDSQALADTLAHVLANRDEATSVAHAGREWVTQHASWTKRVESILDRMGALV